MEIIKSSQLLIDKSRNHLLYNGDVIIFEQLPAILELNALDRLVQNTFWEIAKDFVFGEPISKQFSAAFNTQIEQLQKCSSEESKLTALFRSGLKKISMDIERKHHNLFWRSCLLFKCSFTCQYIELPH
ncbi:hypothetical protein [Neptunomonas japonica]|uniref:hypothetical protein n=1 Tax=Neptunomonas japonica TaxID=417574 RepID=UPI00048F9D7C|nr:hypothetical protein [Neptunomonas japonica]